MWLLPAFSFPIQITEFYAKPRSLYANVSVFNSKCSVFYPNFILQFCTPSHLSAGVWAQH